MSATLSEATGRPYGIQRVCQAWERSRSALYARQTREQQRHKGEEPARRGPTPTVSDATLLEAIQADLDRSPFQGEGHRKVHARLRILDGIRVARTRVLRVMRAHTLLSPHRGRQGAARVHAGTIVTQAPNVMWGTDYGHICSHVYTSNNHIRFLNIGISHARIMKSCISRPARRTSYAGRRSVS